MNTDYIKLFLEKGKLKEIEFAKDTKLPYREANVNEDIYQHFDIESLYENIKLKIDVKKLKRIDRNDENSLSENFHYVEIKNVNGEDGWLYAGKADYISFETNDYWIIISKENLQKHIAEFCKDKIYTQHKGEIYKLRKRIGRKDIITLVPTIDLIYISSCILKKVK